MGKVENMGTNETIETNETNETIETRITTFNSLTPDILKENKKVYTDALDYAFSNNDIKNIAITGNYGAGKSTVWNTYKNNKLKDTNSKDKLNIFKNVITVSVGGYEYYSKTKKNKEEEVLKSVDLKDYQIEKIIINQILSQIKTEKVPLTNTKFKKNKSTKEVICDVVFTCLFLLSIIIWFSKSFIISGIQCLIGETYSVLLIMLLSLILFILPVCRFLYRFYASNKISFSTIKFQGTEANFNNSNDDEDDLEKMSKEIVYLLASSETTVVVFEDLDRFNNTLIFTKLRELNYLLNSYLITNEIKRVVRFVYLVKDGLFYSKDRTKFFDFIIPIIPIVDSNTSMNQFIELTKEGNKQPDIKLLQNISLYVDDMRMIRNIVNEYTIYSNILPIEDIKLDYSKLFSLITLKNIFPNEFQLLQENKGYIKYVINQLENHKKKVVEEESKQIREDIETYEKIIYQAEEEIYLSMAELISSEVEILEKEESERMEDFLRKWQEKEKQRYTVKDKSSISEYDFEEFIAKFIQSDPNKFLNLMKITQENSLIIKDYRRAKKEQERRAGGLRSLNWRRILQKLSQEDADKIFNHRDFEITEDHYFPLIRFLFFSGNLNETYWYYMTNFIDKTDYPLKLNDIIFMKGVLEGTRLNPLLNIESPEVILARLNIDDFRDSNILNYRLIELCLEKGKTSYIRTVSKAVQRKNSYINLIRILNKLGIEKCKKYVDVLIRYSEYSLIRDILEKWNSSFFRNQKILDELIEYIREKNISYLSQFLDNEEMFKKRDQYGSSSIPDFNFSKKNNSENK